MKAVSRRVRWLVATAAVLAAVCAGTIAIVDFDLSDTSRGVYVLKGRSAPLDVQDDLYLEDGKRLLVSVPFEPLARWFRSLRARGPAPPFLRVEWEAAEGEGYVIQELPGGRSLVTSFSRFLDDRGRSPSGIFLGGVLPFSFNRQAVRTDNDSGMAYYDGDRWLHVWCSANEAVAPARDGAAPIQPSDWEFLGSAVLTATPQEVLIADSHRVRIDGIPVRIDKQVRFRAGETFFTLTTRFTNEGAAPARYRYVYGDEPWIGYYGTSLGDVGWTKAGLRETEGPVDTATTDFLGMFDFGNARIGESHRYTGVANFVEWDARSAPQLAYFSNQVGSLRPSSANVALRSMASRFLGLEWGPRSLAPGEIATYTLAQGMAGENHTPPFLPIKPAVRFF